MLSIRKGEELHLSIHELPQKDIREITEQFKVNLETNKRRGRENSWYLSSDHIRIGDYVEITLFSEDLTEEP